MALDLRAFYRFDENLLSTTLLDSSGGTVYDSLSIVGTPTFETVLLNLQNPTGRSTLFPINVYATIPTQDNLMGLSVSFKYDAVNENNTLFSQYTDINNHLLITQDATGKLGLYDGSATAFVLVSDGVIADNIKHHVSIQWDGTNTYMWMDGVKQTQSIAYNPFINTATTTYIASHDVTTVSSKTIDDLYLYNSIFTDVDAQKLYENYIGVINPFDMRAYYKLDELIGSTTIQDALGLYESLTIAGTAVFEKTGLDNDGGTAIEFTTDSYVNVPQQNDLHGFVCTFQFSATPVPALAFFGQYVSDAERFLISQDGDGNGYLRLRTETSADDLISDVIIADNLPHQVAVRYDSDLNETFFYIDGVKQTQSYSGYMFTNGSIYTSIGTSYYGNIPNLTGSKQIDNVYLLNSLNEFEIQQFYDFHLGDTNASYPQTGEGGDVGEFRVPKILENEPVNHFSIKLFYDPVFDFTGTISFLDGEVLLNNFDYKVKFDPKQNLGLNLHPTTGSTTVTTKTETTHRHIYDTYNGVTGTTKVNGTGVSCKVYIFDELMNMVDQFISESDGTFITNRVYSDEKYHIVAKSFTGECPQISGLLASTPQNA